MSDYLKMERRNSKAVLENEKKRSLLFLEELWLFRARVEESVDRTNISWVFVSEWGE